MEEAQSITDPSGHSERLLPLLHFGYSIRSVFQDVSSPPPNAASLSFRLIAPEEALHLSQLFQMDVSPIIQQVFAPPNQASLTGCALSMVEAIVLFAGSRTGEAVAILQQASGVLEENARFWPYASSHLADLVHVCFEVAVSVRDYVLARTLNSLQHELGKFFPSTMVNCLRDEVLLAAIQGSGEYSHLSPFKQDKNTSLLNGSKLPSAPLDWVGDSFDDILAFPLFHD